jgi:hypothetical protein
MKFKRLIPRRIQQLPRRLCFETLEDRVNPSVTALFELDGNVAFQTTHDWDQVLPTARRCRRGPLAVHAPF